MCLRLCLHSDILSNIAGYFYPVYELLCECLDSICISRCRRLGEGNGNLLNHKFDRATLDHSFTSVVR